MSVCVKTDSTDDTRFVRLSKPQKIQQIVVMHEYIQRTNPHKVIITIIIIRTLSAFIGIFILIF